MIITRTPFRASFVGGGSDLPSFYEKSGGAVLSTTINKYMYLTTHPYFEQGRIKLKYSINEDVASAGEIAHPIVRACVQMLGIGKGIEIASLADIPAGTGMGSSSAFTVGLLHNLHAWKGEHIGKEGLAQEACRVELELLHEPIGKQDQYASAYGGMNLFEFLPGGSVRVSPIFLKRSTIGELEGNLLLFYTGGTRSASELLRKQSASYSDSRMVEAQQNMAALAFRLRDSLVSSDLSSFGSTLAENWELKKQLNEISTPAIDGYYRKAIAAGAAGGKLLGAGKGGFLLFYCEKEKQDGLRAALADLKELPFRLDFEGSKILFAEQSFGV